MRVVYTAPNKSHHYPYAEAFARHEVLHAFVSGFPRFGPASNPPSLAAKLKRHDLLQCAFLGSMRVPLMPSRIPDYLAYASKVRLDRASLRWAREADVLLAYNGCALDTFRALGPGKTLRVLEIVSSHLLFQDAILKEEGALTGIPYRPMIELERTRRLAEFQHCDYVLCPSSFVARTLTARGVPREKILRNAYGFRELPVVAAKPKSGTGLRLLYVGQVHLRKGLRYALEALRLAKAPHVRLDIVGPVTLTPGFEVDKLPGNVTVHGPLKGEALSRMFTDADVFILPSIEEGLALVLGEALSFGLPLLATQNTGADDLIEDGKEGFIVPIRDAAALAAKIDAWGADAEMLARMSVAARAAAKRLAGWRESGDRLVATLSAALPKPGLR